MLSWLNKRLGFLGHWLGMGLALDLAKRARLAELFQPKKGLKDKPTTRLEMEALEQREVPLDLWGILTNGFALGSFSLLPGALDPITAFFRRSYPQPRTDKTVPLSLPQQDGTAPAPNQGTPAPQGSPPPQSNSTASNDGTSQQANSTAALDFFNKVEEFFKQQPPRSAMPSQDNAPASAAAAVASSSASVGGTASAADSGGAGMLGLQNNGKYLDPSLLLGDAASSEQNAATGSVNSNDVGAGLRAGEGTPGNAPSSQEEQPGQSASRVVPPTLAQNYGRPPLVFEQNVGQAAEGVSFLSRGPGFNFWLKGDELVFATPRPESQRGDGDAQGARGGRDVFRMRLVGMNPKAEVVGRDDLPSRSNYFTGSDASAWFSNVPNFGSVLVREAFAGVDLVLRSHAPDDRIFEHDFIVKPGADVSSVRVRWEGLRSVQVDSQGRLLLQTEGRTLIQDAPVFYQESFGVRTFVQGSYVLRENNEVGFVVHGEYDRNRPLWCDPSLGMSSYLGGSGNDSAYAVATDLAGNVYLTGETYSSDFPIANGYDPDYSGGSDKDAFVAKVSPEAKTLVFSTYLGGSSSMFLLGNDVSNAISVTPSGEIVVAGTTSSTSFPVTAGALQGSFIASFGSQGFISRLNATGSALLASTYLGNGAKDVEIKGLSLGQSGKAYVTGNVTPPFFGSALFPTTTGAFQTTHGGGTGSDSFLSALNVELDSLVYSTLMGGSLPDVGTAVAVDANENAYAVGYSAGNFPVSGGYQTTYQGGSKDGYAIKFNSSGNHQVSTYLGSGGDDQIYAVAVSRDVKPVVTGSTDAAGFPTVSGAVQTGPAGSTDAFASAFTAAMTGLDMSSYLGGSGADVGYAVSVNQRGEVTIAGRTQSTNFPTYQAFQGTLGTGGAGTPTDGFIAKFTTTGTLSYASYHGGDAWDEIRGLALHPSGAAVVAGFSNSSNLPGVGGSYQPSNAGGYDAFFSKILPAPNPPVITTISSDTGTANNDQITTDQTLEIVGRADPYATVTLERAGVGVLGSVAASATGLWTYNYTGTTLGDGTYAFAARAINSANVYSSYSAPEFLVHVDRTAPTMNVTVPSSTPSRGPEVHVSVQDRYGVPIGTTVTLDVDLNNDNDFVDASEADYASGNLEASQIFIKLPTLSGTGSYRVQARVTDLAGNEGTSAASSFTVTSNTSWTATAQALSVDPAAGSFRAVFGDVSVAHALDLDQSPGTQQSGGAGLVYHSSSVSQKPFVQVTLPSANNAALPANIDMRLTFDGTQAATVTYSTTGFAPGDVFTAALQAPNAITTTGRYSYSVLVQISGQTDQTLTGSAFVVAQDSSEFGAGWTYASVDRLISISASGGDPAGMLRVFGTGGWRFYVGTSTFTSPVGDPGTLTLSGGVYSYTVPDNQKWTFNSSGYMTGWTSADGSEALTYTYDGSNRLTTIAAIDSGLTTLTYNASDVVFQTVNNRTTTLTLSGGDLTNITNPDVGLRTLTYDFDHRLTREQFGAHIENNWEYTSTGVVGTITWGAVSVGGVTNLSRTLVSPLVTRGKDVLVSGTVYAGFTDALGYVSRLGFDARGRLTETVNPLGARTSSEYTNGFLTKAIDPLNRVTSITHDAQGYATSQTLPDGSVLTNAYAANAYHSLTSVVDARGNTMTYAFDSNGRRTSATDAEGNVTSYSYDGNGKLTKTTDARGNITTSLYDSYRRQTETINALNQRTTTTYDANGNVATVKDALGRVTTYAHDSMGRQTVVTDTLGKTTTSTFDAASLPLTRTDPLGAQTSHIYDLFKRGIATEKKRVGAGLSIGDLSSLDELGRANGTRDAAGFFRYSTFDPAGRARSSVDSLSETTAKHYDVAGQLIASRNTEGMWSMYEYDARGRQTSKTDPLGIRTTTAYDRNDNVTETIDGLGRRTTQLYDKNNRETVIIDRLTRRTTMAYDGAGNLTSRIDPMGRQTTYAYDALNRQTSSTEAVGTANAVTSETGYDAVGNVTKTTNGLGHVVTYLFDARSQQTGVIDSLGNRTTTLYDAVGNVTETIDAGNQSVTREYDSLHRQTSISDALANETTVNLDPLGRSAGVITADGNLGQSGFDPLGRNVATLDSTGNYVPQLWTSTGLPRVSTDGAGNQWQFERDALGRETVRIDPTGARSTVSYDAQGRISQATDRLGRVKEYSYDAQDRLTLTVWKTAALVTVNLLTYTYDNNDKFTSAADTSGTVNYGYDERNRATSYTNVYGQVLTFSYDQADRLTRRQDSLGGVLTNSYDAQSRLTSRQFSGTGATGNTVRVDFGYSNRDELTSLKFYSDLAAATTISHSARSYDTASRLTGIVNKDSANTTISYYNYAWNTTDRVTTHTYWSQVGATTYSGTKTYSYDATGQLTDDGSAYSYDANGNRTMAGYATGAANRIMNDGVFTYTHDAEGNLTQQSKGASQEAWYYDYDHNNRLTTIRKTSDGTTNLVLVTYTYDVEGKRVKEQEWVSGGGGAGETRFAYDGAVVWADLDSGNSPLTRRIFGDQSDQVLTRTVASGANAGLWVYKTDLLGSVRDLVNASGQVKDNLVYSGFGVRTESHTSVGDRYSFTGREYNANTELQYNRARFYKPALGRWMGEDRQGFAARDPNLSRYVFNQPTTGTDPSGYYLSLAHPKTAALLLELGLISGLAASMALMPYAAGYKMYWHWDQTNAKWLLDEASAGFQKLFSGTTATTTAIVASLGAIAGVVKDVEPNWGVNSPCKDWVSRARAAIRASAIALSAYVFSLELIDLDPAGPYGVGSLVPMPEFTANTPLYVTKGLCTFFRSAGSFTWEPCVLSYSGYHEALGARTNGGMDKMVFDSNWPTGILFPEWMSEIGCGEALTPMVAMQQQPPGARTHMHTSVAIVP